MSGEEVVFRDDVRVGVVFVFNLREDLLGKHGLTDGRDVSALVWDGALSDEVQVILKLVSIHIICFVIIHGKI